MAGNFPPNEIVHKSTAGGSARTLPSPTLISGVPTQRSGLIGRPWNWRTGASAPSTTFPVERNDSAVVKIVTGTSTGQSPQPWNQDPNQHRSPESSQVWNPSASRFLAVKVRWQQEEAVEGCVGRTYPVLVSWRSTVSTEAQHRAWLEENAACLCKGASGELCQLCS